MSNDFYSISWDSTNIMKSGMKTEDFVSGYALTNKYEDFAESYTFYILHNQEFFERAQENDILRRKYDFFRKISFPLDTFYRTDFTAR